jgi:integrase
MLTKRDIDTLTAPADGSRIMYDKDGAGRGKDGPLAGFGIRITAAGAKAFVLNYRAGGLERRLTIGAYPTWTIAAARAKAKELRKEVDNGRDPLAEKIAERSAPTIRDLASRFVDEHLAKRRPSYRRDVEGQLRRWILPALGGVKVADLRPADIETLHAKVTKAGSPIRANRCIATLSKMMSLAIRWEFRETNPCRSAVERNAETRRKRYLSAAALARLSAALSAHQDQNVANAIRLLSLTGARRSEALSATWDQIDLDLGTWTKPGSTTKQKTDHYVPLSAPALQLLAEMRAKATGPYLFPGRYGRPHLTEIKKSWAQICKAAELDDVRLHDLSWTPKMRQLDKVEPCP